MNPKQVFRIGFESLLRTLWPLKESIETSVRCDSVTRLKGSIRLFSFENAFYYKYLSQNSLLNIQTN